ncbi:ribonuclease Z, partial [Candidatus Bathyarchaeota archaeon]|nr:ribonuclease Z [Candidatus Bathyarchaeota archaeon]
PFHLAFPLTIISPSPGECIEREGHVIRCITVPHGAEAYAYAIEEETYPGKFYPKKAHALGIPPGPLWKHLQKGESIQFNGKIIDPSQISGKETPGNKITYSGDTAGGESLAEFAQGSTVLVHEATYLLEKDRPRQQHHATLIEAMKNAEIAQCNWLILTHFSARYRRTTDFPNSTPLGIPILYAEDLLQVEITKTRKISIKKIRPN